jgi:hypothetical protein
VVNGDASEPGDGDDGADQAAQENDPQKATAGTVELFNLADDPGETNNVAAMNPAKVRDLRSRYDALAKQQVPPKARPKGKGFVSPKVWGEKESP